MKTKKCLLFSIVFSLFFSIFSKGDIACDTSAALPASNMSEKTLIPGGKCIGVTLSAKGVLVTDISDVRTKDGKQKSPAKDAGLKSGDLIQSFNNQQITNVDELNRAIKAANGKECSIKFLRDENEHNVLITPVLSQTDQNFKIGAWVKDAASGIGTVTYFDPDTKQFAALGHGISDSDTGKIFKISDGNIYKSSIVSVNKGKKGVPGELNGVFEEEGETLGKITDNLTSGLFGKSDKCFLESETALPIALTKDVKLGEAQIICNIEGQKTEKFDIEIMRIMPNRLSVQKGMVIKVKDPRLLEKTGGIVRGMSGSPIIQNNRIVGAVTHVFVNDPTRGYGIFIENMLKGEE